MGLPCLGDLSLSIQRNQIQGKFDGVATCSVSLAPNRCLCSTLRLFSTLLYPFLFFSTLLFSSLFYSYLLLSFLLCSILLFCALLCSLCSSVFFSSPLSCTLYSFLACSYQLFSSLPHPTLPYSSPLSSTLLYSTLPYWGSEMGAKYWKYQAAEKCPRWNAQVY